MTDAAAPLTRADCREAIANHAARSPRDILLAAADRARPDEQDLYGSGVALAAFEAKIAALLGKEAALFLPSGTMAQQIALRIAAEHAGCRAFTAHPTNHIVLHEHDGYARLHGLTFVPVGSADRLIARDDVRALREPVATLLLELPQREIGGDLPDWDALVSVTDEARARGWHVHLDGARLWECAPFYARPYAQIAALFDTVYVSFYKALGGLGGAMLAGPAAFIAEARIWQRRHGGNLFTLFPLAAIAEASFDDRIGRMPEYHVAALRVWSALHGFANVAVRATPPPANMLHAHLRGSAAEYLDRAQYVARELGIWTIGRLAATPVPDVWRWEISCGDATVALSDDRLRLAVNGLFAPSE